MERTDMTYFKLNILDVLLQMKYIQPFPGKCVYMDPTAVIDVYALIGTPTLWKDHAALVWRIGPAYLFEKALSAQSVGVIYSQGTVYLGNFLALCNKGKCMTLCRFITGSLSRLASYCAEI